MKKNECPAVPMRFIFLPLILFLCSGCATFRMNFLVDKTEPLGESVIQGSNSESKILLVNIDGVISNSQGLSIFREPSSIVEETVSQLRLAATDKRIKALLLKIDSPGGTTTASDILYHEILNYKKRTGNKVVVLMMDMACSGAYMASLPADRIVAQPTSVTGSVGVIFMRPKLQGLLDKIGVSVQVSKSGENKDMGSPFREDARGEEELFGKIVAELNRHFYDCLLAQRKIDKANLELIRSARIFTSSEALKLGLIDEIGYPEDAIAACRLLAAMPDDSQLVVYRRLYYPDDNIYNTSQSSSSQSYSLVNLGPLNTLGSMKAGFYYIWSGAIQ